MKDELDEARLKALLEAAGLTLRPSELPHVLATARFLDRAARLVRAAS